MKEVSSILKRQDSSAFRARVCVFFFLKKKSCKLLLKRLFIFVVKDWIIVVCSEKGYRLLSYVCPQRKYYTPYGKIFSQIL